MYKDHNFCLTQNLICVAEFVKFEASIIKVCASNHKLVANVLLLAVVEDVAMKKADHWVRTL